MATPATTPVTAAPLVDSARPMGSDRCARYGTYPECPLCGGSLHAEHAHFKCGACGWRDSCCD